MTKDEAAKFLEDLGAKVEWPKMPKGPVVEPVVGRGYWYAVMPPRKHAAYSGYSAGDPMQRLYWETGRMYHTEPEAQQRMDEDQDKTWKMVYVPTLVRQLLEVYAGSKLKTSDFKQICDFIYSKHFHS